MFLYLYLVLIIFIFSKDPYYRFNDKHLSWLAENDWKYERTFKMTDQLQQETWLICEGLDTVAKVILNGQLIGSSSNMFVPQVPVYTFFFVC